MPTVSAAGIAQSNVDGPELMGSACHSEKYFTPITGDCRDKLAGAPRRLALRCGSGHRVPGRRVKAPINAQKAANSMRLAQLAAAESDDGAP
jgi:hypothetical protein